MPGSASITLKMASGEAAGFVVSTKPAQLLVSVANAVTLFVPS